MSAAAALASLTATSSTTTTSNLIDEILWGSALRVWPIFSLKFLNINNGNMPLISRMLYEAKIERKSILITFFFSKKRWQIYNISHIWQNMHYNFQPMILSCWRKHKLSLSCNLDWEGREDRLAASVGEKRIARKKANLEQFVLFRRVAPSTDYFVCPWQLWQIFSYSLMHPLKWGKLITAGLTEDDQALVGHKCASLVRC